MYGFPLLLVQDAYKYPMASDLPYSRGLLEKLMVSLLVKTFINLYGKQSSSPSSQKPAIGPHSEPV